MQTMFRSDLWLWASEQEHFCLDPELRDRFDPLDRCVIVL